MGNILIFVVIGFIGIMELEVRDKLWPFLRIA